LRKVASALPLIVVAALLDCTDFPTITADTCGNGVVDPGEDCDTFPKSGTTTCGAPGTAGACRYECVAGSPTMAPTCPAGWGCASTNVCREPSGQFGASSRPIAAGAWRVDTGDFNDDHLADVLTREEPDGNGLSRVRVHFFDSSGALTSTNIVPTTIASPRIADFDDDQHSDLLFANSNGVGIMLADDDGTLEPVPYPTLSLQGSIRIFPATGVGQGGTTGFAGFGQDANGVGIRGIDAQGGETVLVVLPKGPDALAGDLLYAKYFESDPCAEAVIAYKDASNVLVYAVCKTSNGAVAFNDAGISSLLTVALPSGITVDSGVIAGDVDGDGHLDLVIGAQGQTYVAYGTGGALFHENPVSSGDAGSDDTASLLTLAATSSPFVSLMDLPSSEFTGEELFPKMPLAVGDLNADGVSDFVLPDFIMVSSAPSGSGGDGGAPPSFANAVYEPVAAKSPSLWTQAAIADFNRDGAPDVVAGSGSSLDLDYFNAGNAPFSIPTDGPVAHFAVGDFDGDLYPDLVFSQSTSFGSGSDEIAIAYGQNGAPLQAPTDVGNFAGVVETRTFTFLPGMLPQNLLVMSQTVDTKATTTSSAALMQGSSDRQPLALFSLTQMSTNGSPIAVVPVVSAQSPFPDVAAFAGQRPLGSNTRGAAPYQLWAMRDTQAQTMTPASFTSGGPGPDFDSAATPQVSSATEMTDAAVLLAAADFDRNGTPDIATILPFDVSDGSQSALYLATPQASGAPFTMAPPVSLPFAVSLEGELEALDVDVDGAPDLVLLTGDAASLTRQIVVLWNDGNGGFSATSSSVVNAMAEIPQGFAPIQLAPTEPPALAYVTHLALQLAHVDAKGRTFTASHVAPLLLATGVVAADVNGDGVQDLAVADTENLVVFLGTAVHP
jgi:hypothetical protein